MKFDTVVIGAGHAGCEAGHAAARLGLSAAVITLDKRNIGFMPCNPSIGGTAKGHLVCEIDALGGIMGVAADKTAIQIRMLNEAKGSAVASLRAQIDKDAYHDLMQKTLEETENLTIIEDEVTEIISGGKRITGVKTKNNGVIECRAVVVATGVYLQSKTFMGTECKNEGPSGFPAANGLTKSLLDLGLEIRRFKTGTPARIQKQSVDFAGTEPQRGDDGIRPFSFIHSEPIKNTALCHLTYTNTATHKIIRDNIAKSAMYGGLIVGIGPRYCPSIEDKVMRFANRNRHQIFLEPETKDGDSIYLQGMSTSLPNDIQTRFIRTIDGLHAAEFIKYGYAIEYDCINSLQLLPTLEYKGIHGLFFAGQVNGTSGYEEAAAQGLIAGINAGLYCKNTIYSVSNDNNNTKILTLPRTSSYIGVLIDDLTTVGTNEPYRMFTARAEHRLWLRQDNADSRLTPIGREIGLVDDNRWGIFERKQARLAEIRSSITPKERERLKKPGEVLNAGTAAGKNALDEGELYKIVETEIKYAGYLAREENKIAEAKRQEATALPPEFDYTAIKGLRKEAQIKLNQIRPLNIGQAGRISGVTPADIAVLLIYLKTRKK
jgi:tRNA uridine 5-carboxymethylaminomethyl modification enzyme